MLSEKRSWHTRIGLSVCCVLCVYALIIRQEYKRMQHQASYPSHYFVARCYFDLIHTFVRISFSSTMLCLYDVRIIVLCRSNIVICVTVVTLRSTVNVYNFFRRSDADFNHLNGKSTDNRTHAAVIQLVFRFRSQSICIYTEREKIFVVIRIDRRTLSCMHTNSIVY